jgi:hypothetical protein
MLITLMTISWQKKQLKPHLRPPAIHPRLASETLGHQTGPPTGSFAKLDGGLLSQQDQLLKEQAL